ncbi:MAG TPA: hypothetical protein VKP30_01905 [Polyangiaceae bacterium]|nr:hypothetical protein [Polyangiaceae bacterium]
MLTQRRLQTSILIAAVTLGSVGIATNARAEDPMVTATAREITKEGILAYEEGRYDDAEKSLALAYSVMQLPTIGLYRARALEKRGKLVQSSEQFLAITRLEPAPSWQPIQAQAQREAQQERDALVSRIPRLQLQVVGADPAQTSVTIDGVLVPTALLAMGAMVNPGHRVVVARHGERELTEYFDLQEGQRLEGTLSFTKRPSLPGHDVPRSAAVPTVRDQAKSLKLERAPTAEHEPSTNLKQILGWTALGLGGVGLVVGSVEGAIAVSKRNALLDSDECPNDEHCTVSASGRVEALNTARTVSSVGFIAGGLFAAAGATLLLWPKTPQRAGGMALTFGPGFVNAARFF